MMNEAFDGRFHSEEEDQQAKYSKSSKDLEVNVQFSEVDEKERFLDPPRELPKRSYSLEPDMANGWKPKKNCKANLNNVFSVNYDQYVVDEIVKELYKNKKKYKQSLVYLGPRKNNSYILHEDRRYENPYPIDKKMDQLFSSRNGLPQAAKCQPGFLKFNSDFEGGNLDVAIQRSANEFDLFMRVDTNTRGHTNWYFFEVCNEDFIGTINFNICNFRRDKSLYQRGLKPYVHSKLQDHEWHQAGKGIRYQKSRPRYDFLYEQEDDDLQYILNTYFTMSFAYDFIMTNDTVQFAYCVPYTYSRLIKFISSINSIKILPSFKSLSGLPIPVLEITNEEEPEYNKKVVLVTGRIHPGQSNSSFVAEGIIQFLCGNDAIAKQLRKSFIFYVIPMINPDGVVAGNYRTSFFGKDLNRTFDQSRKYAFPETFHLLQFTRQMKMKHKKRFCFYIDLHGHSVKKNIFMYGPDFNIQHTNYELSRQLPRLLGNITSYFRYYSCIFRITGEKSTTARAILNRSVDIPFTYTMQSSNGFYYDSVVRAEVPFTARKWKQMGMFLCKAFNILKLDQRNHRIQRAFTQKISKDEDEVEETPPEKMSDDQISEGKSDSEPEDEDFTERELKQIEDKIQGKIQEQEQKGRGTPPKDLRLKASSKQLTSSKPKKLQKHNVFLPPINSLNRAHIFSTRHKKKQSFKQERLKNIESQLQSIVDRSLQKPRFAMSQLVVLKQDLKASMGAKKESRFELFQKFRISK